MVVARYEPKFFTATGNMSHVKKWVADLALRVKAGEVSPEQACTIVRSHGSSVNAHFVRMSTLKKEVKRLGGSVDGLALTDQELHRATSIQRDRLVTASENVEEVRAAPLIEWARDMLVLATLDAVSTDKMAVALAIVTGRRQAEILTAGSFELVDERHIMFTGQLKARGEDRSSYKIPVLAPASDVITALAQVQKKYGHLTVDEVSRTPCNVLANVVKSLTDGKLTFHSFRMMYGLVCYELAKPHSFSINAYLSRILGHASMTSSIAYTKMRIVDMEGAMEVVRK